MRPRNAAREIAILGVLCSLVAPAVFAQSTLPPVSSTTLAASPPASAPEAATPIAPIRQAQVSYQLGQLTIIAENSSLAAILRDVGIKTGMQITGNVVDQQVYGTYGPAAPSEVLRHLLEGSGNDMILRESATKGPVELVLTPVQGMPSSPIQSSRPGGFTPASPRPYPPQPSFSAPAPPRPGYVQPQPAVSQPVDVAPDQPAQAAPGVPQSPGGASTPQQIFEQLQRMEQQKAHPPAASQ